MESEVLLGDGPVLPVGRVPVSTVVVNVGAVHVANVLELCLPDGQLGFVGFPEAVRRVIAGHDARHTPGALVNPPLDENLRQEGVHQVVYAPAVALGVQAVHAEQDVEGRKFERVHPQRQGKFHVTQMEGHCCVAQNLHVESGSRRNQRELVHVVQEERCGPRERELSRRRL